MWPAHSRCIHSYLWSRWVNICISNNSLCTLHRMPCPKSVLFCPYYDMSMNKKGNRSGQDHPQETLKLKLMFSSRCKSKSNLITLYCSLTQHLHNCLFNCQPEPALGWPRIFIWGWVCVPVYVCVDVCLVQSTVVNLVFVCLYSFYVDPLSHCYCHGIFQTFLPDWLWMTSWLQVCSYLSIGRLYIVVVTLSFNAKMDLADFGV